MELGPNNRSNCNGDIQTSISDVNKLVALENELAALRERVQYLESLLLTCNESSAVNADFNGNQSDDSEGNAQKRCAFCDDCTHSIHSCKYFELLQVGDRWSVAKKLKLCYRCLNNGHIGKNCKKNEVCGINRCRLLHDRQLHDESRRRKLWGLKTKQKISHSVVNCDPGMECEIRSQLSYGAERIQDSDVNPCDGCQDIHSTIANDNSDVNDSELDSYSSSDESVTPEGELSIAEPSGGGLNERYEFPSVKDYDLSLWLQPLSKASDESCENVNCRTPPGGESDGFAVGKMGNTYFVEPINNMDSFEDAHEVGIGVIEPLAYSMRNLKLTEFAVSGIEMIKAECMGPPNLNEPPVETKQNCGPPAGIAGIDVETRISSNVLTGPTDEMGPKKVVRPDNVEMLSSKGMLLVTLSNYLQQIDEEIQYYEGFASPAEGFRKKRRNLNKSEIDLLM